MCAAIYFSRTETHIFRGFMIQSVISRSKPNPLSFCFFDSPAMIDCYLELWAEIIFFSLSWFCLVFCHSYWKETLKVGADTLRCRLTVAMKRPHQNSPYLILASNYQPPELSKYIFLLSNLPCNILWKESKHTRAVPSLLEQGSPAKGEDSWSLSSKAGYHCAWYVWWSPGYRVCKMSDLEPTEAGFWLLALAVWTLS